MEKYNMKLEMILDNFNIDKARDILKDIANNLKKEAISCNQTYTSEYGKMILNFECDITNGA